MQSYSYYYDVNSCDQSGIFAATLPAHTPVAAVNWSTTEWDIPGSANILHLSVTGPVIPNINATRSMAPTQFLLTKETNAIGVVPLAAWGLWGTLVLFNHLPASNTSMPLKSKLT